ncbi:MULTISPECIES: hypothetical protein [unclassified Nocardioides]|uniref:hypothetical protein n=1 Tax=unclassified Nocardioides TaxID=2615069 RepID=UPI000AC07055|nr:MULTISPECIES: hypothetical protein [unclassified Nocardioides]
MKSGVLRLAALSLVAVLALAGCGGGDDDKDNKDSKDDSSQSSDGSSTPEDDGLTDPGSALELGEPATFKWQATAKVSGQAEVTVTRIDKAPIKAFSGFKLSDAMKKSTPYYVHLRVKNAGTSNLGGFEPPVFLDNGSSILYPAAHISGFAPCADRLLPKKFGPNAKPASLCMVFLAPAKTELRTVALRPDEAQEQIDWTGDVTAPGAKAKKGAKKKR